jgi:hypothetical protein
MTKLNIANSVTPVSTTRRRTLTVSVPLFTEETNSRKPKKSLRHEPTVVVKTLSSAHEQHKANELEYANAKGRVFKSLSFWKAEDVIRAIHRLHQQCKPATFCAISWEAQIPYWTVLEVVKKLKVKGFLNYRKSELHRYSVYGSAPNVVTLTAMGIEACTIGEIPTNDEVRSVKI